ncbi:hypothetical protein SCLCIDRAFT_1214275 [Scleroderma citrinum Foug A]|uniref:Uncharacterized protein n=1 Tax=Scleroderma citrinum Foug A TaxID=1036808 RepID=A0A0C3E5S5_9AGAM|nr:hypothetical protein SCLCIDRAFT_1214275 [Scleroderma citrinum Foug A]
MPRDLPGMYWDEERNRYFPLSSTPPCHKERADSKPSRVPLAQQRQATPGLLEKNTTSCSRDIPHHIFAHLRSLSTTTQKDRLIHRLRCSQFALTDKVERSVVPCLSSRGSITAFLSVCHSDRVWQFSGDSMGWFYSYVAPRQNEAAGLFTSHNWRTEFNLSSEVSSICVDDSKCIATSFGPDCRILHLPLDSASEDIRISRIDSRVACDIWTADLHGSRLVLGANKQAVCIDDISERAAVHHLPTGSDVFAVAQQEHIIYSGLRNGSILRFDNRVWKPKGDALLGDLFAQPSNSITNLRLLCDSQLLVTNVDGKISTFDLRFISPRVPLKVFIGNVNSYSIKAPIAVDPSEEFLFAAGQDNRIRLWSLRSGGPPLTPSPSITTPKPYGQELLQYQFEEPVRSIQISEEGNITNLWAASGYELFKYSLGQRISGLLELP